MLVHGVLSVYGVQPSLQPRRLRSVTGQMTATAISVVR